MPTDSFQSSIYWVTPVFQPGSAPDTTPPSVTFHSPTPNAVRISPDVHPTVTWSEPVGGGATLVLRDAQGNTVPGSTPYNDATRVLTLTPSTALAASGVYAASVSAIDPTGNAMTTPDTWTFTVDGPQTCPCSLLGQARRRRVPT